MRGIAFRAALVATGLWSTWNILSYGYFYFLTPADEPWLRDYALTWPLGRFGDQVGLSRFGALGNAFLQGLLLPALVWGAGLATFLAGKWILAGRTSPRRDRT